MLLIKSPNVTSQKRWQILVKPIQLRKYKYYHQYFYLKTSRKLTTLGHKNIKGMRFQYKTYFLNFFIKKIKVTPFVGLSYNFRILPAREFIWCKSLYGQVYPFLHTELSYPGFKMYGITYLLIHNLSMINQFIPIYLIPINTIITFLFNIKNQYITYAKSSGCIALKRKNAKKIKLTYVELPSGALKLFPLQTFCLLSNSKNLFLHNIIEGGWGTFTKPKKVIHVRGVAKNPVDHPNGGRTKAKQPELSPWGWIAKLNK